jgi:hypothetical protein
MAAVPWRQKIRARIGCATTRLHLLSAMAIAAWWRLFKILVAVFHVLVMG